MNLSCGMQCATRPRKSDPHLLPCGVRSPEGRTSTGSGLTPAGRDNILGALLQYCLGATPAQSTHYSWSCLMLWQHLEDRPHALRRP